jgi:hypothetical protein
MASAKIAITMDESTQHRLDRLVKERGTQGQDISSFPRHPFSVSVSKQGAESLKDPFSAENKRTVVRGCTCPAEFTPHLKFHAYGTV